MPQVKVILATPDGEVDQFMVQSDEHADEHSETGQVLLSHDVKAHLEDKFDVEDI